MIKQSPNGYLVFCPACQNDHLFDHRWQFNNNFELPTFTPSLVVEVKFSDDRPNKRCHSFLINGEWHYLNDCTHGMTGKIAAISTKPE